MAYSIEIKVLKDLGETRTRGTGPRATVTRAFFYRNNKRGGNPLACACGMRGPPHYGSREINPAV